MDDQRNWVIILHHPGKMFTGHLLPTPRKGTPLRRPPLTFPTITHCLRTPPPPPSPALRMTESRYSRSSTTCGDVNRGHSSVLGAGSRPSTSPHPGKCRAPTRRADSSESHSRGTLGLFDPRTAPRATRFAHPEEDSSRRAFANATHMEKEETPSLDVAEALWWFVVSISHQNLGVDLTSNPR